MELKDQREKLVKTVPKVPEVVTVQMDLTELTEPKEILVHEETVEMLEMMVLLEELAQ